MIILANTTSNNICSLEQTLLNRLNEKENKQLAVAKRPVNYTKVEYDQYRNLIKQLHIEKQNYFNENYNVRFVKSSDSTHHFLLVPRKGKGVKTKVLQIYREDYFDDIRAQTKNYLSGDNLEEVLPRLTAKAKRDEFIAANRRFSHYTKQHMSMSDDFTIHLAEKFGDHGILTDYITYAIPLDEKLKSLTSSSDYKQLPSSNNNPTANEKRIKDLREKYTMLSEMYIYRVNHSFSTNVQEASRLALEIKLKIPGARLPANNITKAAERAVYLKGKQDIDLPIVKITPNGWQNPQVIVIKPDNVLVSPDGDFHIVTPF